LGDVTNITDLYSAFYEKQVIIHERKDCEDPAFYQKYSFGSNCVLPC